MIRPSFPTEQVQLIDMIIASGLFLPDQTNELNQMLTDYFAVSPTGEHFWITATSDANMPVGVAYYALERMTVGTWNLYLLAVAADYQNKGIGTALMQYVEQHLAGQGERVLLVETSGLPDFEATRSFYRNKMGYDEEARIREFYQAGEDKIVFRKALTP